MSTQTLLNWKTQSQLSLSAAVATSPISFGLLVPVNQFVGGFSSVIMWRIQDADCYALDRLLIVCDSNRSGSLQSLIFMMILMFCTLEVVLFKTLIALNLTEGQNRVTY